MPELLLDRKDSNFVGGDWNSIVIKSDCMRNPESKMSPALAKLIKTFQYTDSFKAVFPHDTITKSHYYDFPKPGGTRIDRLYHHNMTVASVGYVGVGGLSDHMALVCSFELPQD